MINLNEKTANTVFDYRALRLLVGIIALVLPWLVIWISGEKLTSISASYHTEAQDVFVGLMFVVSAFLLAYNGRTIRQKIAAKIGSACAFLVAICPTACDLCGPSLDSRIHSWSATILFVVLAYFCLRAFRHDPDNLPGLRQRRLRIYFTCGCVMIVALATAVIANWTIDDEVIKDWRLIFYVELLALTAFGVSWITAGKWMPFLIDRETEDALVLFRRNA